MTTAILIPSLNRPQRLATTVANIHAVTEEPHRLLFCVGDPASKSILKNLGEWFIDDTDEPDKRYVTRMNKLVQHIEDADYLFFGSDDVLHHPYWLRSAQRALDEQGVSLVVVNDLRNRNGTQAVMRAEYLRQAVYDAPGMAFHSGYHHNFADNEQFFTAFKRNQYGRALESVVEHLHPGFSSANAIAWDDTYHQAQAGWEHDSALFDTRAKLIDEAL